MHSIRAICLGLLLIPLFAVAQAVPTVAVNSPSPADALQAEASKPPSKSGPSKSSSNPAASKPAPSNPAASHHAGSKPASPNGSGKGPTLPSTGKADLPPPTDLTLKYVGIGVGVQNYTCASSSAAPKPLGAIATLFDGTALASSSPEKLHALPAALVGGAEPQELKKIGDHYFDASGTPVFDLAAADPKAVLFAAKAANVSAPAPGAVDWLFLKAKPGFKSVGLRAAYRVKTAGGKATCKKEGPQSVPYAAEYWFYA